MTEFFELVEEARYITLDICEDLGQRQGESTGNFETLYAIVLNNLVGTDIVPIPVFDDEDEGEDLTISCQCAACTGKKVH